MTDPRTAQRRAARSQFHKDFPRVCDLFGFDAAYRKLLWHWLERSERGWMCYRQIARTLEV